MSTRWPWSTRAWTPAGVSATRCSPVLISLGTPMITDSSPLGCRWAPLEEQGLLAGAEGPVEIGQRAPRDPGTPVADRGLGAEQDPGRARRSPEQHGEVGVDEGPRADVDDRGDAAREVGRRHRMDERGGLLVPDERPGEVEPGGRRAGLQEVALDDSCVDAGEEGAPGADVRRYGPPILGT